MEKLINVFIGDSVKRKFLAVRRSFKDNIFGGMLALPGGKIEEGETTFEAASREIKEETGARLTWLAKEPLITSSLNISNYQAEIAVFKGEIEVNKFLPLDSGVEEVVWVNSGEFLASLKEFKYPNREIKKMEFFLAQEGYL